MSLVLCERNGPIALLTLNRPEALNALSAALEEELASALASAQVREASALIIRGAGDRAFSAGADTGELDVATPETALAYYERTGDVYEQLARLPLPSIAQIHGWCVGGGLELALACDLRVAEHGARFWFPEVERGILPSSGGTARAVRALGPAVARRLILLGEKIDADQARALGVIHELVPKGEVEAVALGWAQTLAARPRRALQVARLAIDAAADGSHAAAITAERLGYAALAGLE
jgi:enoyl-CoA hydratase/carnithine racemase